MAPLLWLAPQAQCAGEGNGPIRGTTLPLGFRIGLVIFGISVSWRDGVLSKHACGSPVWIACTRFPLAGGLPAVPDAQKRSSLVCHQVENAC